MGRKREKKSDSEEELRTIIKNQRALIRHLQKELKRAGRDTYHYQELQNALADSEAFVEFEKRMEEEECPSCGKNGLKREQLGARILLKCKQCEYSKFEKPSKKN